jgi:hypothetical protein
MITLINVKNLAFTGQVLALVGADTKWVHFYQNYSKQKIKTQNKHRLH